ncbi:MAG: FtsX-like permease family protein [Bacteroidota bacterium]
MIAFLWKGIIRDRSRSLFPVLIVAAGVMLTVFIHAYLHGVITIMIQTTAHYNTGHVRVMTKAYASEADQIPNDLALLGTDTLITTLQKQFPELYWTPRIRFGGLLDVPDAQMETRAQSPVFGFAADFLTQNSPEWNVLNIKNSIVRGTVPTKPSEILIADDLAVQLKTAPGETVTLIGSTMNGSMAITNFTIAGTVRFGVAAMDRGTIIADLSDVQRAMDMQNGAGEILGFFRDDVYHAERADEMTKEFNSFYKNSSDEFAPVMGTLRTQSGMSDYLDLMDAYSGIIIGVFVFAMSIVLWNTGLTGSLRRYGEIGVRIAIGEEKGHVYRSMLVESIFIGIIGSSVGTVFGLMIAYYLQEYGINIEGMMKNSSLMISNVIRAQITPVTYVIGFFPGLLATIFGTAISGIGIYKRQTAQLFKELET